ncbi:transporter [Streptomyces sp. NPDC097619]|uniref:sodium:solute symporter family transporter n=1 Tax=Streptomyces sp. NPDC097619 TaxID=3157228 RepID=UPI00332142B6
MTRQLAGSSALVPIGSDVRGPVIIVFLVFVGISLLWLFTLSAAQDDGSEKLYLADRSLSPLLNGVALAGELMSVVTLLAVPGAIALFGYDGFVFAIDGMLALGIVFLLARRIRDSGRYTLGGVFALRVPGRAPRIAAIVVALAVTIPLLLIQLRAAGIAASHLIGLPTIEAQAACTVLMGLLVACCAVVADLRGSSTIHVVKVLVALLTLAALVVLALSEFGGDPGELLSTAAAKSLDPEGYFTPGSWQSGPFPRLDGLAMHLVEITGIAVLPQLILRVGASRSGRAARRSVAVAGAVLGAFTLLLVMTGFAAVAVVGGDGVGTADANGQSATFLLASSLFPQGSPARGVLITAVACLFFLALLTTVTSVTFAAGVTVAEDGADSASTSGRAGRAPGLRTVIVLLCVVVLSLSAVTYRFFVDFLMVFVVSVAASAIFPALVLSLFWARFNRRGLLWSVYGGLLATSVLMLTSPNVSGSPFSLFPDQDFVLFPFMTPGLFSVPLSFLLGWLGGVTGPAEPVSCHGTDVPPSRHHVFGS